MRSSPRFVFLLVAAAAAVEESVLKEAFRAADTDGNGFLELDEFLAAVNSVLPPQAPPISPPVASSGFHGVPPPRRAYKLYKLPTIQDTGFYKAFVNSLGMIWATELGDKTFFIAAVLAMRNSRLIVFAGAITALAIMTVLSAALGYALPSLLPRKYTHYASAALFLYFGLRLLRDASQVSGSGPSDELVEVEDELRKKSDLDEGDVEDARNNKQPATPKSSAAASHRKQKQPMLTGAFKVFSQACALTFLAEWGDRSQIATIALAAAKDPYGVILGGITGHAMCTGLAVLGGRMLASRISEKTVALVGGILFLVFSLYAFFFEDVPDSPAKTTILQPNAGLNA